MSHQLFSGDHVSAVVTSDELLQSQLEARARNSIETMKNNFQLILRIIGNTTEANGLLSGLCTNIKKLKGEALPGLCTWSGETTIINAAAAMYSHFSALLEWRVPGYHRGCFVTEGLRRSDLRCFFNQTCLAGFRAHLEPTRYSPLPNAHSIVIQYFRGGYLNRSILC